MSNCSGVVRYQKYFNNIKHTLRIDMTPHQKTIHDILHEVSQWLLFQKHMGLSQLPYDKKYRLFHDTSLPKGPHEVSNKQSVTQTPVEKAPTPPEFSIKNRVVPFECKNFDELQALLLACPGCKAAPARRPLTLAPIQKPSIMVVTDTISYEEEIEGRYFTGEAMELLKKMLTAIDLDMNQVYLTGLFKCRTTVKPQRMDVEQCARFLLTELHLINPKAILSFTPLLSTTLLGKTASLSHLRKKAHLFNLTGNKVGLFFTHSPNIIVKNKGNAQKILKIEVWQDLQLLQETLTKNS